MVGNRQRVEKKKTQHETSLAWTNANLIYSEGVYFKCLASEYSHSWVVLFLWPGYVGIIIMIIILHWML